MGGTRQAEATCFYCRIEGLAHRFLSVARGGWNRLVLKLSNTGIYPVFFVCSPRYNGAILILFDEGLCIVTDNKTWMCLICGWIYDEAAGAPEHGITPGTLWKDVPMNWTCPECGARKEDFEMVQI